MYFRVEEKLLTQRKEVKKSEGNIYSQIPITSDSHRKVRYKVHFCLFIYLSTYLPTYLFYIPGINQVYKMLEQVQIHFKTCNQENTPKLHEVLKSKYIYNLL